MGNGLLFQRYSGALIPILSVLVIVVPVIMIVMHFKKRPARMRAEQEIVRDVKYKKVKVRSWLDRLMVRGTYKAFGWNLEDSDTVVNLGITEDGNTYKDKTKYDYFSRRAWFTTNPFFAVAELVARFLGVARRCLFTVLFLVFIPYFLFVIDFVTVPKHEEMFPAVLVAYVVCLIIHIFLIILGKIFLASGTGSGKEVTEEERARIHRGIDEDKSASAAAAGRQRQYATERAEVVKENYEARMAEKEARRRQEEAQRMVDEYNRSQAEYRASMYEAEKYSHSYGGSGLSEEERFRRMNAALEQAERSADEMRRIRNSAEFAEMERNGDIYLD